MRDENGNLTIAVQIGIAFCAIVAVGLAIFLLPILGQIMDGERPDILQSTPEANLEPTETPLPVFQTRRAQAAGREDLTRDEPEFTTGQAITRCQDEVESTLNINLEFESAFRIGTGERAKDLPNNRFRIKSWYDIGDGVERRFTCVISFTEPGNPDEYGAVISDGW